MLKYFYDNFEKDKNFNIVEVNENVELAILIQSNSTYIVLIGGEKNISILYTF